VGVARRGRVGAGAGGELTGLGCRGRPGEGAGRQRLRWEVGGCCSRCSRRCSSPRARVREEMRGPREVREDGSRAPWADGGVTKGCARVEVEGAPSSAAAVDVVEMTYTLGAEEGGADEE
ncbi:unnamed protein product, partial [Pylaiella littoralis]